MANMTEVAVREREEENDPVNEAVPPSDIVAFNESRSCADLYRLFVKKQLDISPDFQRKIVWSDRDQTVFVDSLIKQMPIPSLCISLDAKTQNRVIIDGLQRMSTIVRFLNYEQKDWKMSVCKDVDKRISGKNVSKIVDDFPELFTAVENLTLPITVLRCDYSKKTHMDYLFNIFRRLNSGGRRLLNQEIRNCVYQGNFNDYLREVVRSKLWLETMHLTIEKVENGRYGNEERVLRFFAMNSNWTGYSGRLAEFLNEYMSINKNLTANELYKNDSLLKRVLCVISRMRIPVDVIRNKNLMEGLMVGVSKNIDFDETLSENDLATRYARLKETEPYSVDVKEGMAHADKVKNRVKAAIKVFGPDR